MPTKPAAVAGPSRALWMSTIAFTVCFAVWTIFAIIGIQIKRELNLNETQFGLLVGTPILSGSLIRIALGVWTDQYGGRIVYTLVMLAAAVATYFLTWATTYPQFLIAAFSPVHDRSTVLACGLAGNIRRGVAHLLLIRGADLWRPPVDDTCHMVVDDSGRGHRLRSAEPEHAIFPVPCASTVVRVWRRQLRLVDVQHLVLLPAL